MKTLFAIVLLSIATMTMGCATGGAFISEEVLPALSNDQRADVREGAGEFIRVYDEKYNLDGTPKVDEEDPVEPEPEE